MVSETDLAGAKPAFISLESITKLTSAEFDMVAVITRDVILKDVTYYQRLVKKLIYASITKPDISFVFWTLSQFMQMPKRSHLEVVHSVVRYLKGIVVQGIWMKTQTTTNLIC